MATGHLNPEQFPPFTNTSDTSNNGTVFDPYNYETVRTINIIVRPFLIGIGTIGNMMAFFVMQGGSLRKVSTCFYMSVLALVDTGESFLLTSIGHSPFLNTEIWTFTISISFKTVDCFIINWNLDAKIALKSIATSQQFYLNVTCVFFVHFRYIMGRSIYRLGHLSFSGNYKSLHMDGMQTGNVPFFLLSWPFVYGFNYNVGRKNLRFVLSS